MKTLKYISSAILLVTLFTSCHRLDIAGIFNGTSPHHDARFEQSMEWNEKYCAENGLEKDCIKKIKVDKEYYEIYWATDVHVAGTTVLLDSFVNMALGENYVIGDIVFDDPATAVIFAGDIIDATKNYPLFYKSIEPLENAGIPVFCTPGNHDLCFGQWTEYVEHWHTSCYWFEIECKSGAKDLFISFDSGDATLGKKQFNWLKNLLKTKSQEGYRHIICFSHTHMFKRDTNNAHGANFALEEIYEISDLFAKYNVEYYICGHDHTHEETKFKNVTYYTIGAMKDSYLGRAAYMVMTVFDLGKERKQAPISVDLYRMDGTDYFDSLFGMDDED
ncbi:MAG: metallophosphoesterase [Paludibacteraceae bacterium]|nr:metallophosphoesterase [Paludibacteraceae bacterium]MBR1786685.1 metallophosphoesterase [Paludibacteraceae bacterium]